MLFISFVVVVVVAVRGVSLDDAVVVHVDEDCQRKHKHAENATSENRNRAGPDETPDAESQDKECAKEDQHIDDLSEDLVGTGKVLA